MKILLTPQKLFPSVNGACVVGDSLGKGLTINQGRYFVNNSKTLVEGLGPCVGLTAWAGDNKFIAHSAPELQSLANLNKLAEKIVENLRAKLRNSYDEVHAFITGGIQYDPSIAGSSESFNLIDSLYNTLQKKYVPTTVIAGQKSDGLNTRMKSVSYRDSIFVSGKPIDDSLSLNPKKAGLQDALEEQFDFVELIDEIPVEILRK